MADNSTPHTILFVDDESNILSSLKRLFRPAGYNIFTANSGADGLQILEKEKIDVVVSDMRMPEMDGAKFLEQVNKRWPDTIRILLTGYADINATIAAVNEGNIYRYISKPWEDNDITITIENALNYKSLQEERNKLLALTNKQNEQLRALNKQLDNKVKARTEELQQAMAHLEITHKSLKKQYISTVNIFTNLIEMRLGSVSGHYRRLAEQARQLALDADLNQDKIQDIVFAALLLDIGKIGLPDNLINLTYDKVLPIDRPKYEKYPIIGEASLVALEPLSEAAKIIRNHTENYNGSGFPDRLKGNDIPIGSRIIALANDYELLLNGTLLQRKITPTEARNFIIRQRGKRYDPSLVDIFIPKSTIAEPTAKNNSYFTTPKQLKPGMIVSEDLFMPNGMLLVSKGQTLNDHLIKKIQGLESSIDTRFRIHIKDTQ